MGIVAIRRDASGTGDNHEVAHDAPVPAQGSGMTKKKQPAAPSRRTRGNGISRAFRYELRHHPMKPVLSRRKGGWYCRLTASDEPKKAHGPFSSAESAFSCTVLGSLLSERPNGSGYTAVRTTPRSGADAVVGAPALAILAQEIKNRRRSGVKVSVLRLLHGAGAALRRWVFG